VHEDEPRQGDVVLFYPKIGPFDIAELRAQARQGPGAARVDH
jgi:hypothetical protein